LRNLGYFSCCTHIVDCFLGAIPALRSSFRSKTFFSKPSKELPLVALSGQEKNSLFHSRLSTTVWAKIQKTFEGE